MYIAANPSREINRFLASQLLEMYSKIYASVVLARRDSRLASRGSRLARRVSRLARRDSRLARRETRGGNLLLSGTVFVFEHETVKCFHHCFLPGLQTFLNDR